ncbi:MAG: hypothetical protein KDB26_10525 [Microthrixaceae bacterium]|nr:hypothetical protein [Microthrixaceae bacterium]
MPSTDIQLWGGPDPFAAMDPLHAVLPVPLMVRSEDPISGSGLEGDPKLTDVSQNSNNSDTSSTEPDTMPAAASDPEAESAPQGAAEPGDSSDDKNETAGRGWVVPPGGSRVDALFVVSPTRLGIGRTEGEDEPVWVELMSIRGLDAIGDGPKDGLTEVEITTDDGRVIGAGWTETFCNAVVEALSRTIAAEAASLANSAPESRAERPAGVLELEDVTYLGGFPNESKKRKRCTAVLSEEGMEVSGPGLTDMRLAWGQVRSVEAQNSDEARFRTNTKIHRDSSALVFECDDDVTVMLEARDCPTIPLRQAIVTLLDGLDVAIK